MILLLPSRTGEESANFMQLAASSIFGSFARFLYFKQIPSYSLSSLLEEFSYKLLRFPVEPGLSCFCRSILEA